MKIAPKKISIPTGNGFPVEQVQQQVQQGGFDPLEGFMKGNGAANNSSQATAAFAEVARLASQMQAMGMTPPAAALAMGGNVSPLSMNQARQEAQRVPTGADAELLAMSEAGGGGGYFEDKVFALMCKVVEDMQKQIEERLNKLQADAKKAESESKSGGGGGGGGGGDKGSESRNIEFEKIKFDMQKLSQMQQAMSNVLNTMDELAKSAIRHIKAG